MCPVNEGIVTVEGVAQLPETAITGSFYYASTENILYVYNGQSFVPINNAEVDALIAAAHTWDSF